MKIISSFKDYYDYLQGIYGVDEKVVYERHTDKSLNAIMFPNNNYYLSIIIGNEMYHGVYKDGKFYYKEKLAEISTNDKPSPYMHFYGASRNNYKGYSVRIGNNLRYSNTFLSEEPLPINNLIEAPVGVYISTTGVLQNANRISNFGLVKNPKLSDLNFGSVLPPHDIYLKISDYLTPKDEIKDNRTNKERIESAGFDLIHSFRNTK